MSVTTYHVVSWERMSHAVEEVRLRLLRAAATLKQAHVPYAVAGGKAVADWMTVGLVDATWLPNLPVPLRARLQELLDNPEG